jgi:hypothetical protein
MADDKSKRGSPDSKRVDVKDPNELRYWTQSLHVKKDELVSLVKKHGTSAEKLRTILKNK